MTEKIQSKIRRENKFCPKIVFYTSGPWIFRATSIGYLYEIAQVYPVVLLAEELDFETEEVLKDKELFPKLGEIIPVRQFTGPKMNFFAKNRYFCSLAKDIIQHHKPDIVILVTDIYPFDLYLTRFAKRINAITIILPVALHAVELKQVAKKVDITNAYFKLPPFLPFSFRLFFIKLRKYLGYFLYNWIMPLMVGELPFWGKSSIALYSPSGLRADYLITYSKQDYDLSIKEGVPAEKLYILNYPLKRQATRKFFERAYFLNSRRKYKTDTKTLTLLFPCEKIGFRRSDYSIISEEEMQKNIIKIITLITKILKGWRVFIKLHPNAQIGKELEKTLNSISDQVKITNPSDPVDRYIEISDVIIASAEPSTAIFTASLQCPDKPIISLDFHHELSGDYYKDFEGIEYIDNEEKFIKALELIRDNKYYKKDEEDKVKLEAKEFPNTIEMLKYLFQKEKDETF